MSLIGQKLINAGEGEGKEQLAHLPSFQEIGGGGYLLSPNILLPLRLNLPRLINHRSFFAADVKLPPSFRTRITISSVLLLLLHNHDLATSPATQISSILPPPLPHHPSAFLRFRFILFRKQWRRWPHCGQSGPGGQPVQRQRQRCPKGPSPSSASKTATTCLPSSTSSNNINIRGTPGLGGGSSS